MSGWVAIPRAAIVAVGRKGRGAVVDLYDRAHSLGYAWTPYTERDLADEWTMSRDGVREVLDALEAAGMVELERSTPRSRRPSRLRVLPAVGGASNQTVNQSSNQKRDQRSRPESGPRSDSQPEPQPVAQPDGEPPRAYETPRPVEIEIEIDQFSSPRGGGVPPIETSPEPLNDAEHVAALCTLQDDEEPQHGPAWSTHDRTALERAMSRGITAADLRLVWAYMRDSSDPDAEACRSGNWRRWRSILKHPLGADRIAAAKRWDAAGRPRGPPARASPPQRRSARAELAQSFLRNSTPLDPDNPFGE